MSFVAKLQRAREVLEQQQRLSARALSREIDTTGAELDEIIAELIDIQQVVRRDGPALVWIGDPEAEVPGQTPTLPNRDPREYTPKHLADKILQSKSAIEGERKQVTVLFADVQGSLELASRLDPEQWHALLDRYFALLTEAVHRFEGTVNQYTGDGVMALFGAPIAHEDHAQRACYAALQVRDRLRTFAENLRLAEGLHFNFRIGLNSGEVVVGKIGDDLRMDYTAQGSTVGIAQRVEQLAAPGHVTIGGATARLVAGYFQLRAMGSAFVKGLAEPLSLFELEAPGSARSRLEASMTRGASPFVGRTMEMQALETSLANAARGHGQVVGIVGEPGLGKSRLCLEFVERCRHRHVPVFEAHCPAHGKHIPYLPILELFRNYFGIRIDDDAVQARRKISDTLLPLDPNLQSSLSLIFEFMGVAEPDELQLSIDAEVKQRQMYDLMHRVVHAQDARGQVTVTLIDDVHWIDTGSDGFVAQLVNAVAGKRNLVVLNFRPEYVAAFAGRAHYQQLSLVPLDDAPLRALISDRIGGDDSVQELSTRIAEWTRGNPFYTEELIAGLIESGDLVGTPGSYRLRTAVENLAVPTNVRAVLAARMDRLPEPAKRLLQTASVIGKEFSGPLLEEVSELVASEHAFALEQLKDNDFVHERALYPNYEYAFKHPLTQEVAYQSMLQSRRAAVHALVGRALEHQTADRLEEHSALIAQHHESAGDSILAASWYRRAAEWAIQRDALAAARYWNTVRALLAGLPQDSRYDRERAFAGNALVQMAIRIEMPGFDAESTFHESRMLAERAGDMALLTTIHGGYGMFRCVSSGDAETYWTHGSSAARIAEQTQDPALRVIAGVFHQFGAYFSGRLRESVEVGRRMMALVREHGLGERRLLLQDPLVSYHYGVAMAALQLGEWDVAAQAVADGTRLVHDSKWPEGVAFASILASHVAGLGGDRAAQLEHARCGTEIAQQIGSLYVRVRAYQALATAENQSGDAASALQSSLHAQDIIDTSRIGGAWRSGVTGQRIHALLMLKRHREAFELAQAGVADCRRARLLCDLSPWVGLIRAALVLGKRQIAVETLEDLSALVAGTGAVVHLDDCRRLQRELA